MTSRVRAAAPAFFWLIVPLAFASDQEVRFDAPAFVEGRTIPQEEFQSLHPNEKLVDFAWDVSAEFGVVGAPEAATIIMRLHTVEPDVTIVDYCPRSVLDSDVAGPIEIERANESSSNLGFQANSAAALSWGANASAGVSGKNSETVRYQKKPPLNLSVSSSLMDRGTGLLVKIRKSEQLPLEGVHPVRLTLRMPLAWRTGFLRLEVEAISQQNSPWSGKTLRSLGKKSFLIPILLEGDEDARLQARALRQAEKALRAAANAKAGSAQPTGVLADFSRWAQADRKSQSPSQWLDRVTSSYPSAKSDSGDLPRGVSVALKDYQHQLNRYLRLPSGTLAESATSQADLRSGRLTKSAQ